MAATVQIDSIRVIAPLVRDARTAIRGHRPVVAV
jgi:hypothetical protein